MPLQLRILVRFHDCRYHGAGGWPPAPARLFQAFVAAAARGAALPEADWAALEWLERLEPPRIWAPPATAGRSFVNFVPNNNIDAVGGDVRRLGEIRDGKRIRPWLLGSEGAVTYEWAVPDGDEDRRRAEACTEIAERLYQFGGGVDMAWAWGEVVNGAGGAAQPAGVVHRPAGPGEGGQVLLCPRRGSLASLKARFDAAGDRFRRDGRAVVFRQPPPPRFDAVRYEAAARRLLFEFRDPEDEAAFAPQRLEQSAALVQLARDRAIERLARALPNRVHEIETALRGRGAGEADKLRRIQIVPLPSIGHPQADQAIRRLLVVVPGACPLSAADMEWALSGLEPGDGGRWRLLAAADIGFLEHYGSQPAPPSRFWRSVTPAALPWCHQRFRSARESAAGHAVRQALRHAGLETPALATRVQREPFHAAGAAAGAFATNRFPAARLFHAEVEFREPVGGPVVIGDGRFLGLGLMAPVPDAEPDVREFALRGNLAIGAEDFHGIALAVRRALMSLARDELGRVPRLFSGHDPDGGPAASGNHDHAFLAAYASRSGGELDRVLVAAPWACARGARAGRREDRAEFDRVVSRLRSVRAGHLGVFNMEPLAADAPGPALATAAEWVTVTPYQPTRHAHRREDRAAAVTRDVLLECRRRGFPSPRVQVEASSAGPDGGGFRADVRLSFAAAVRGPMLLGRDSHQGGGLFLPHAEAVLPHAQ